MTEEQIERRAELRMDALDRAYLNGGMAEADYREGIRIINNWCRDEYRAIGKAGKPWRRTLHGSSVACRSSLRCHRRG